MNGQLWLRASLPPEHGSWAVLLGCCGPALILRPSLAGLGVCGLAICSVSLRHALRLRLRLRDGLLRSVAGKVLGMGLALAALLSVAIAYADGWPALWVLAATGCLAAAHIYWEWCSHKSRDPALMLSGSLIGILPAAAVMIADGTQAVDAITALSPIALGLMVTVMGVSVRIRRSRGRLTAMRSVLCAAVLLCLLASALSFMDLRWAALLLIALRQVWVLLVAPPAGAMAVGLTEVALLTALAFVTFG